MRQNLIELNDGDQALLEGLAQHCRVPRVEVLRWAVRFYALRGPWTRDVEDRVELIGTNGLCVIGPRLEGVNS
ncbi:MAG: hypothetical protein ACRDQ6_05475 [Pseudonocardiaceae bacterium]